MALSHLVGLQALALGERAVSGLLDLGVVRLSADEREVVIALGILGAELLLRLVVNDLVVVVVALRVDLVVFVARLAEILALGNHFSTHRGDHWAVCVFQILVNILLSRRYNSLLGVGRADVVVLVPFHARDARVFG